MTPKVRFLGTAIVVVIAAGVLWFYRRAQAEDAPVFRYAAIQRGDVAKTVSATGALSAVTTVAVGTQVSGQVAALYADFNDHVKKGELLARIDPTLQKEAVSDAEAGVERAQAALLVARNDYNRNKPLADSNIISQSDFDPISAGYATAQANLKSAQVALDRAKQNLAYTEIYAPIEGVVVDRNVNVGQTVAASLSAPQIFLIANDLTQMQILASVDESDIGQIAVGQPVSFVVQAYPTETFTGAVKQVRLQSTTTENVVSYTVVVSVANPDGRLMPGMTATVKFLTGAVHDVLTVPNIALRFQPTADEVASNEEEAEPIVRPAGATPAAAGRGGGTARSGASRSEGTIWTPEADGKLYAVTVHVGLTDGQKTEVESDSLSEGMQVVTTSVTTSAAAAPAATQNPFQQQQRGGGGRGGGAGRF